MNTQDKINRMTETAEKIAEILDIAKPITPELNILTGEFVFAQAITHIQYAKTLTKDALNALKQSKDEE